MATLSPSSILYGASGKLGGVVFRQVNGKTVVQAANESNVKRSALQLMFNDKMRMASAHAKAALRDPVVRAHYEKKMKRLNVSSPYTAACTDFLRNGCIDKVDTSKYDKGQIVVMASKADLGFEEVTVKLSTQKDGQVIKGKAVRKEHGLWLFRRTALGAWPSLEDAIITIEARDKTGNVTRVVQEREKVIEKFHDWPGAPHRR